MTTLDPAPLLPGLWRTGDAYLIDPVAFFLARGFRVYKQEMEDPEFLRLFLECRLKLPKLRRVLVQNGDLN